MGNIHSWYIVTFDLQFSLPAPHTTPPNPNSSLSSEFDKQALNREICENATTLCWLVILSACLRKKSKFKKLKKMKLLLPVSLKLHLFVKSVISFTGNAPFAQINS